MNFILYLKHELRDDSVKRTALEVKWLSRLADALLACIKEGLSDLDLITSPPRTLKTVSQSLRK